VHVVAQKVGNGKSRRDVRRALLVDKFTGLLRELPTTYVSRHLGQKSLNTQIAVLYDLAFYFEWSRLKLGRSIEWICPEERVRRGQLALTSREINDLANWCQASAADLANACRREAAALRFLAPFDAVESKTTTGGSTLALIQSVRLNRARMLIQTSKMTIEEVARQVGYEDATALRRLMQKTMGGNPSRFRST
jgi:AraC-like DNA-binding protein